jgi:hypothetical protein
MVQAAAEGKLADASALATKAEAKHVPLTLCLTTSLNSTLV